jgi:DNA replication and repair protein RecF
LEHIEGAGVAFHLTHLTLSHVRSHLLARLKLDARPVALWGANGAGKTNVLEAVSMLSPGRGLRRAAADEIARAGAGVGWKVTAGVVGPEGPADVETWAVPGGPREVRVDGKAAPQARLSRVARMLWLTPAMDRLWIEGADGRRRFLDRIVLSFEPGHGDAALTYEKAMRERNRMLREGVTDAGWYGAVEAQMAAAGATLDAARRRAVARLIAAQAGVETVFPAADLELVGPDGEESAAWDEPGLRDALVQGRRADMGAGRTLSGPHRDDLAAVYAEKAMPADRCSTGEQKALLLSIVLANARALAADIGAAPILLLDEVAAHLDPERRAALYSEVLRLGAQAWMTGTEPALFEGLGTAVQGFEVRAGAGGSEMQPAI